MLNKYRNQTGSAHVVIIIILIIAILGVLGYVAWNNLLAPKSNSQTAQNDTKSPQVPEKNTVDDPNKGYLVLKDWGVKFQIPDGLTDVKYYKVDGYDSYELTTSRVEDLGGDCTTPPVDKVPGVIRLDGLSRTQTKREEFMSSQPANNNEPINGYYYIATGGQSLCSNEGVDIQKQDRDLIYQMILAPIAL